MIKGVKNYLLVVLLSVTCGLITVNWYQTGNPSKFFLLAHKLENTSDNINDIDVEFVNRKVFLNVHLKKQTSCKKIITDLGINNIIVSSRLYVPSCAIIDKTLIRITYSETINT